MWAVREQEVPMGKLTTGRMPVEDVTARDVIADVSGELLEDLVDVGERPFALVGEFLPIRHKRGIRILR